jgi:hypothetical protein
MIASVTGSEWFSEDDQQSLPKVNRLAAFNHQIAGVVESQEIAHRSSRSGEELFIRRNLRLPRSCGVREAREDLSDMLQVIAVVERFLDLLRREVPPDKLIS